MRTSTTASPSKLPIAAPRKSGKSSGGQAKYTLIALAFIFCLVLLCYPVLYSFSLSFRTATVDTFVNGAMSFCGLDNYLAVVADPVFWVALTNTVVFTLISLLFQFGIGFFLALLFQERFLLKNVCLSLLLIPWVAPLLTSANIFKALFNQVGPINQICMMLGIGAKPWLDEPKFALAATIVTNIWVGFPFNFILLYAGMRSIPPEIYEAAKLDGASYWSRVLHMTAPILKPVAVAVLMLGTIYTVKVFDIVWIMTGGGPANGSHLLSTYAYQTGFSLLNFGEAAAIATIAVLLILLLNLLQIISQRR